MIAAYSRSPRRARASPAFSAVSASPPARPTTSASRFLIDDSSSTTSTRGTPACASTTFSILRAMRRLASVLILMAACSGDDDAPAADAPAGGPDAAGNPTGQTITLTLEPFDVPGGTERQVCKTINLPAGVDVDIVRMHSTMVGTSHHFNVYKQLTGDVTAPVMGAEAMVND